jgi:cutinase
MVALTEKAASQCPSARIVWGGYSQGAQVTHKAASRLPSAYYTRIAGIMLFGDPDNVRIPAQYARVEDLLQGLTSACV